MDDNPCAASRLGHGNVNDRNEKYRLNSNGTPEKRSAEGQKKSGPGPRPGPGPSQVKASDDDKSRKRDDIYSDVFDALERFGIGL